MIKKIQAEIDSFTHGSRLPDFEDEELVPYLKAFIKEALRYWSFIPSRMSGLLIQARKRLIIAF